MSEAAHTELLCNYSARTNWINNMKTLGVGIGNVLYKNCMDLTRVLRLYTYSAKLAANFRYPSSSSEAALFEGFVP